MNRLLLVSLFLVSCTVAPATPPAQGPTTSLAYCQYQESLHATELAGIAHQRGAGTEEIDTEFVSACVSVIDNDTAQIVKDLAGIADAGAGDAK